MGLKPIGRWGQQWPAILTVEWHRVKAPILMTMMPTLEI
jgi:hypothetical protein